MPNLYQVTYQFTIPVRKPITVEIIAECEEDILEFPDKYGLIQLKRHGAVFGPYDYDPNPAKLVLLKENVEAE
jgi:hypothetical protein